MTEPLEFVAVTTRARAKRHWSLPKTAQWGFSPLCNTTPRGVDQADVEADRSRRRVRIADLPPCLQCDKSRKRREDETKDLAKALRESLQRAREEGRKA